MEQVFELWHGSIRYHDEVFRLFYILDLLCDWARQYQRIVQRCLMPDQEQTRHSMPASLTPSHRNGSFPITPFPRSLLPLTYGDEADSFMSPSSKGPKLPADQRMDLNESRSDDDCDELSTLQASIGYPVQFPDPPGSDNVVAVRSENMIKLQFQHVYVSEQNFQLLSEPDITLLKSRIATAIMDGNLIPLSAEFLRIIEVAWLQTDASESCFDTGDDCFALFKFDVFFDSNDLLPVRLLSCLTISTKMVRSVMRS